MSTHTQALTLTYSHSFTLTPSNTVTHGLRLLADSADNQGPLSPLPASRWASGIHSVLCTYST